MTRFQERVYRTKGIDRKEILAAAAYAPVDTSFFLLLTAPLEDMLQQMLESTDPATRSNLDELFRTSGRYTGIDEVIHMLDSSLKSTFGLIVRENDYRPEMATNKDTGQLEYVGPPHDDQPVFAFTVLMWMQDQVKIEQFRDTLKGMSSQLGLEGRTPGSAGVFTSSPGGWHQFEFWTRFVPGTGVMSHMTDGPLSLLSNTISMPAHVMRTHDSGGPNFPRLTDRPEFTALLDEALHGSTANLVLWCDPSRASPTLLKQADVWAKDMAASNIDWDAVREREENRLLPEIAPGKKRDTLSDEEKERLASEVDAVLRTVREKEQDARYPALREEKKRQITYFEAIRALVGIVRLDERHIDIGLQAAIPLPEPLSAQQ
jgi:hypothetical protein